MSEIANWNEEHYSHKKFLLINTLRYFYLSDQFDENFWSSLMKPGTYPCEAEGIIEKFEIEELSL